MSECLAPHPAASSQRPPRHGAVRSVCDSARREVVPEQAVEAIPAPLPVERHDEQVGALGPADQLLCVGAPGERLAQGRVESVGDRHTDQEGGEVGIQAGHDLVGEVVDHEPLVAGEGLDDGCRVGGRAERDCRKLQGSSPSLGPAHEILDDRRPRIEAGVGQAHGPRPR
jgi:hypothetical protein